MNTENASLIDQFGAAVEANRGLVDRAGAGGVFHVKCFDAQGNLKWETEKHNLVMNLGLQDMNTQYFKGTSYTAAWYIGLVTGPGSGTTYNATDALNSHPNWTEDTNYSGNRKTATFGTVGGSNPSTVSNSASPASFSITGTTTIAGAFLCNVNTGNSGLLFSASDFQSPGDRSVVSGDTLSVTYTFSLTAT